MTSATPGEDRLQSTLMLTDLYQLTMLHGYHEHGMEDTAVFEFFVRDLPEGRNFLVAAGLEQALDFLDQAHFSEPELQWLREHRGFPSDFVEFLSKLRFTGDVDAMAEGTFFFPDEPILRVTAPIAEAQLMETRLINLLHMQTLIASKAVRCALVAPEKLLVDFGLRRAHGAEAGLLAARAGYLAGLTGTATVLAGQRFGIPIFGTIAHSFIEAHDREIDAFANFAAAEPNNVTLLIDTYDTEKAARKVVKLAQPLASRGINIKAVRIDSGDLVEHAKKVRKILDEGGLTEVGIFSSGNLDEYAVRELINAGAPVGGFGIGTRLDTSADAPYLDCAYKLTEYAGRGRRKKSEHKVTWPGRKQVYRHYDDAGHFHSDVLTVAGDDQPGEPLLHAVMRNGRRVAARESLETIRQRVRDQIERLPPAIRTIDPAPPYSIAISDALRKLANEVDADIERRMIDG